MNKKRIVITGIGVISPLGIGKDVFWSGVSEGRSGTSEITTIDTSAFNTHCGGEVRDFFPERYMDPAKVGKIGRTSQYAIAATKMALEDAGIPIDNGQGETWLIQDAGAFRFS